MMNRRAGFSLVEVALAIMVIAVGLLSVFGLFPHGMESSRRALDETRAATFAEDTFNSLRVMAQTSDWASLTHRFSIPAPDWWGNTYVWANHPYVLTNIYSNIISNITPKSKILINPIFNIFIFYSLNSQNRGFTFSFFFNFL